MSDKQPTPQLVSVAQDLVRERDELRAEVEQLKADYNAAYTNYVTQRDEAERLRALVQEHITVHQCLVCGREPAEHKGVILTTKRCCATTLFAPRPCGNYAVRGALKCRMHGGKRPTAVARCPGCDLPLKRVTYRGGYLNEDQWAAERAGDWYCEVCPPNDRSARNKFCYWWDRELLWAPSSQR